MVITAVLVKCRWEVMEEELLWHGVVGLLSNVHSQSSGSLQLAGRAMGLVVSAVRYGHSHSANSAISIRSVTLPAYQDCLKNRAAARGSFRNSSYTIPQTSGMMAVC
jgi:hypothetical protein